MSDLTFREGHASDLEAVYQLGERAWDQSRADRGLIGAHERWVHEKPMLEFMTAL